MCDQESTTAPAVRWIPRAVVVAILAAIVLVGLSLLPDVWAFTRWRWPLPDVALRIILNCVTACLLACVGALARRNGRHFLIMCGVGLVCWWALLLSVEAFPLFYRPGWRLIRWFIPAFVLGLVDLRLAGVFRKATLFWLVLGAWGAGSMALFVTNFAFLADWTIPLGDPPGSLPAGYLLQPSLYILSVWATLLCIAHLSVTTVRRVRVAIACILVVFLAAPVMIEHTLLFQLSKQSLLADGPFDRFDAAHWIRNGGSERAYEVLWQSIEQADWEAEPVLNDWRFVALGSVCYLDSAETSHRLMRLLETQSSDELVRAAAPFLCHVRNYEAVPVVLSVAFQEAMGTLDSSGRAICTEALEGMGLPRAALPVLFEGFGRQLRRDWATVQVSSATRSRLAGLLGRDVGDRIEPWLRLYDDVVSKRSALPEPVAKAADLEIEQGVRLWALMNVDTAAALSEKGCPDIAERIAHAVIAVAPEFADGYYALGEALSGQGRRRDAIAAFSRVVAIDPRDADALVHRASESHLLGEHHRAVADLRAALTIDPEHSDVLVNLALTLADIGEYAEAHTQADAAIAKFTDSPWPYWAKANVCEKSGDLPAAIRYCERVIQMDEQSRLGRIAAARLPELRAKLRDESTPKGRAVRNPRPRPGGQTGSPDLKEQPDRE